MEGGKRFEVRIKNLKFKIRRENIKFNYMKPNNNFTYCISKKKIYIPIYNFTSYSKNMKKNENTYHSTG